MGNNLSSNKNVKKRRSSIFSIKAGKEMFENKLKTLLEKNEKYKNKIKGFEFLEVVLNYKKNKDLTSDEVKKIIEESIKNNNEIHDKKNEIYIQFETDKVEGKKDCIFCSYFLKQEKDNEVNFVVSIFIDNDGNSVKLMKEGEKFYLEIDEIEFVFDDLILFKMLEQKGISLEDALGKGSSELANLGLNNEEIEKIENLKNEEKEISIDGSFSESEEDIKDEEDDDRFKKNTGKFEELLKETIEEAKKVINDNKDNEDKTKSELIENLKKLIDNREEKLEYYKEIIKLLADIRKYNSSLNNRENNEKFKEFNEEIKEFNEEIKNKIKTIEQNKKNEEEQKEAEKQKKAEEDKKREIESSIFEKEKKERENKFFAGVTLTPDYLKELTDYLIGLKKKEKYKIDSSEFTEIFKKYFGFTVNVENKYIRSCSEKNVFLETLFDYFKDEKNVYDSNDLDKKTFLNLLSEENIDEKEREIINKIISFCDEKK